MKDYPYVPGWRLNKENNKPAINHSILMLTTHGVAEGEWNGNEWVQYRWSCKLKDSEVLYWTHLEDLEKLEKEGDSLQQEQSKVDLVAELKHHLATTPKEQLEKEWKELEPWSNIGPTVQEFLYGKQQEVDLKKAAEEYEKKIADAYEKGKQEGIRVVRSWESSPGQGRY